MNYDHQKIESKWREIWKKNKTFQVNIKSPSSVPLSGTTAGKAYYNLMMFPYPSAEGLHVGNVYAFTGSDIWGRYMQMKGFNVFEPIGLDGFGIHSENYAIKLGKHPADLAKVTEKKFYDQLSKIGNMFSWDNHLETYDADYYRWTQWIFIQLFKAGLAYRKKAFVNWCPSCKTVLADEQVLQKLKIKNLKLKINVSVCERCETEVVQKDLEQWFFRITDYADRLLKNLDKIDWTEKVLTVQRNWIAKSEGININYTIINFIGKPLQCNLRVLTSKITGGNSHVSTGSLHVTCFTTRPDTNFGATFVVMSPENPLIDKLKPFMHKNTIKNIEKYLSISKKKTKEERITEGKEKTGVFTGLYCLNQLNNYQMPLWISDFVVMDVGTGVVVGVPGHDIRDFEFAKKYSIEIKRVVVGKDGDRSSITKPEQVQEDEGIMINSGFLDGLDIHKATQVIMDYIEKKCWGKKTVHYHLRDWLISRQRYWGPPIPMINCPKCGWQPVEESKLPVELPYLKDYRSKGTDRGPLASLKDWVKTICPKCGGSAKRETDVSDTFLDSSWYFLRYPSINIKPGQTRSSGGPQGSASKAETKGQTGFLPWNKIITKQWLPVDMYIGGAEHSVLHLLYSRFITMFFKDQGLLDFEEPFTKFRAHGLIIKDGAKMSKSKGNIVNPDEYILKYGADTLRCYLMFLGPLSDGGDFRDAGMKGMNKFLARVWRLVVSCHPEQSEGSSELKRSVKSSKEELFWLHKTIKRVTSGIERLKYNTSIAALMEYVNFLEKPTCESGRSTRLIPSNSAGRQSCSAPDSSVGKQKQISAESIKTLILLLAPFAPHLTEELWQQCKGPAFTSKITEEKNHVKARPLHQSIHHEMWPKYDPKMIEEDKLELVIQVNGRVRDRVEIDSIMLNFSSSEQKQQVLDMILKSSNVQKHLNGKTIKKSIFVPGKLVNLVV